MGRPTKPIELTEEEQGKLQQWARRPRTSQRLALRARIVLGCADGLVSRVRSSHTKPGDLLENGVSISSPSEWLRIFVVVCQIVADG